MFSREDAEALRREEGLREDQPRSCAEVTRSYTEDFIGGFHAKARRR